MIHFKRWLLTGAVLFRLYSPGLVMAHPAYQEQMKRLVESKIPENLDLSREKSGATLAVRYAVEAPEGRVPVAELHSWTIAVLTREGAPADVRDLEFEADMPQHLHGLGSVPRVTALGRGRFRVDGLNFQMPGWWQVVLKTRARGAEDETICFDLVL